MQNTVPKRSSAKHSAETQCKRVQVRRAVKARRAMQKQSAPEEQCRSTVPQKGSAEAQCPRVTKRCSDENSPWGLMQSKVPQRGSAKDISPEGQCRSTVPKKGDAKHSAPEGQRTALEGQCRAQHQRDSAEHYLKEAVLSTVPEGQSTVP